MRRCSWVIVARRRPVVAAEEVAAIATRTSATAAAAAALPAPTLRLTGSDPLTLDPAIATDSISASYIVEIFGGLVTLDKDLKIAPDIAKSWDVSPDGKTYTFHLRDDVVFQPTTAR